jgi:hypothetical protein
MTAPHDDVFDVSLQIGRSDVGVVIYDGAG